MRLINVRNLLDIDMGKRVAPDASVLEQYSDEQPINMKYAILSHCWGAATEEITFREMEMLSKMASFDRKKLRQRPGYQKILKSCEQANKDEFKWLWVDTCCINAESSSELSEAINSMFRWYEGSGRCYAYLHDVDADKLPTKRDDEKFGQFDGWPKWFSRGWTLQELVAPSVVQFFNQRWQPIGNKNLFAHTLKEITRIPSCILQYGLDADHLSVAQIMSWAADRKTTRVEDRAYSLLGLFGVHMPMLYGEGKNAFRRLQLELIRMTNDHSVFAWDRRTIGWSGSVLADDPSFFRDCEDIVRMEPDEYLDALKEGVLGGEPHTIPEESLRTYSVTNAGIQIWLPLNRSRGSDSLFEARLACRRSLDSSPITIMLVSFKSNYYRYFGHFQTIHGATAEFQLLYLAHREEKRRKDCTFKFDDSAITCEGFARRCVFPKEVGLTRNSLTLSSTHHSASIVYANSKTNACFVLAVGYCLGHEWARIIFDPPAEKGNLKRPPGILDPSWYAYVEQAYSPTTISPGHTHCIVQARPSAITHLSESGLCLVKHAHLPRSIKGVQIFYQRLPQPNTCLITIDITHCTGCCVAPDVWKILDGVTANGPKTPGLMMDATLSNFQVNQNAVHCFLVDTVLTRFMSAVTGPAIKLGDYGRWDNLSFEREGNIFEDMKTLSTELRIDSKDLVFRPNEHKIRHKDNTDTETKIVESVGQNRRLNHWEGLTLYHPRSLSLPVHHHIFTLMKSLSHRLEGMSLITTVVECSECYAARAQGIIGMPPMWSKHGNDNGSWNKLPITTPLFVPMKPLFWCAEKAHTNTRTQFELIRNHFRILVHSNPHLQLEYDAKYHSFGTAVEPVVCKQVATGGSGAEEGETAMRFFRGIFGGAYFKDHIGDISLVELRKAVGGDQIGSLEKSMKEPSSVAHQVHHVDVERTETEDDSRIEFLVDSLMKKMPMTTGRAVDPNTWLMQKTKMYHEAEGLRSKSFGAELLGVISIIYQKALDGKGHVHVNDTRSTIRFLAHEVKILEGKCAAAKCEDEKRALEEDITGKILLACWLAIRSEIEQVLAKVVRRIVADGNVDQSVRKARAERLKEIGKVLKQATVDAPHCDQAHLRRIMSDAETGTSKHGLLLISRVAQHTLPLQERSKTN